MISGTLPSPWNLRYNLRVLASENLLLVGDESRILLERKAYFNSQDPHFSAPELSAPGTRALRDSVVGSGPDSFWKALP